MRRKYLTMEYRRNIEIYGDYFADFYDKQSAIVRRKINYVLNLVRTEEQIPAKFLKSIEGAMDCLKFESR